jgi:ketosteroid isomerase-like protein
MSQENVQLHSRANRAFNTRNVEAFVAFCDPQIELRSALTVPGGGIYHGHDGVRRWHRDLEDVFGGEIGIDPEVFFDLGEYTVTFHVLRGRGQQSGAGVATPAAHLCRWRDGRIIHFKGYVHREEVFSDLGIPKDAWKRSRPDDLSELDTSAGSGAC